MDGKAELTERNRVSDERLSMSFGRIQIVIASRTQSGHMVAQIVVEDIQGLVNDAPFLDLG